MYSYFQKLNKVLRNTNQRYFPSFTGQLFQLYFLSIPDFRNTLLTETSASPTLLGIPTLCISASKTNRETFQSHWILHSGRETLILNWMPRWLYTECISSVRLAVLKKDLYSWCQVINKTLRVLTKRATNPGEIMRCVLLHLLNIPIGHRYLNALY